MKQRKQVPCDAALKQRVEQRVAECVEQAAQRFQYKAPAPRVSYDLKGYTTGEAHLNQNMISVNVEALTKHTEDYLRDTIAHEVAHLVAWVRFNTNGHGRAWRVICRALGGTGSRCSQYDVTPQRTLKTFTYRCACREHELTSIRHNRIRRGRAYRCGVCNTALEPAY